MSAFRLQTFAPGAPAAPKSVVVPEADHLEALALAREEAFRSGYLTAQAEVTQAFLDDRSRLTSEFIEALNDARVTNEAARRHVLAGLAPTVMALCGAILGRLADAGLAAAVAERVDRALTAAPGATPRLRCAPELVPTMEALFAARGIAGGVEASRELGPRDAELHWDEGFDRIDLDGCVASIGACLAAHLAPADGGPAAAQPDDNGDARG